MRKLTVKEFAEIMNVHPNTVHTWIKKGLPVIRIGNFIRIDEQLATDWMQQPSKKNS